MSFKNEGFNLSWSYTHQAGGIHDWFATGKSLGTIRRGRTPKLFGLGRF